MQCYHIVSRLDHVHFLPKRTYPMAMKHGYMATCSWEFPLPWMFHWANHRTKNELSGNFQCHVWRVMKHTDTSIIGCFYYFYIQNLTLITHPNRPDIIQIIRWTLSSWTMSRTWSVALPWLSSTLCNHRVCALERRSENWHDLRTMHLSL